MNLRQIFNFSILWKHTTTIKICSVSYNSSLVNVAVSSSMSVSKFWNHLYFSFQFTSLTVRSWRIDKDLCTIKCCINHGIVWDPTFFTDFICHWSIVKLNNKNSNRYLSLSCYVLNCLWKFKSSNTSFTVPWCKLSCLEIIISICENHFWSYSNDFVIVHYYSCIIKSCFMEHRASNIDNNSFSNFTF